MDACRYCASCWAAASARLRASSAASRQRFATVLNWAGVISAAGVQQQLRIGAERCHPFADDLADPVQVRDRQPPGAQRGPGRRMVARQPSRVEQLRRRSVGHRARDRNQPTGLAAPSSAQAPEASQSPTARTSSTSHRSHRRRNSPSRSAECAAPDQPARSSPAALPSARHAVHRIEHASTLNPGCDSSRPASPKPVGVPRAQSGIGSDTDLVRSGHGRRVHAAHGPSPEWPLAAPAGPPRGHLALDPRGLRGGPRRPVGRHPRAHRRCRRLRARGRPVASRRAARLDRRGRELLDALELAAQFPTRHRRTIEFPAFPPRSRPPAASPRAASPRTGFPRVAGGPSPA